MNCAVLRVSGEDFNVDAFLREHPRIVPDVVWHVGDQQIIRGPCATSGFNTMLAESTTIEQAVKDLRDSVAHLRPCAEDLTAAGATSIVDFGMTISLGEEVMTSAHFDPIVLGLLASMRVGLSVSVYLSDEDSPEEDLDDDSSSDPNDPVR